MAEPPVPAGRAYEQAPLPAPELPWRQARFTVIDLELTGLTPGKDEIISFATLTVAEGRLRLSDGRYRLVRPQRMPEGGSIRIHGLRPMDLERAPTLDEVLDELLQPLTGTVLVAHAAAVERGFLTAELGRRGITLRNEFVDTAALGADLRRRRRRRGSARLSLSDLARSLELPVHRPHHADGDALTTAQVFLALATHLDQLEPQTVGSLIGAGGDLRGPSLIERLRRRLGRDPLPSSARP